MKVFLIGSTHASQIRNILQGDEVLPCIDIDALDSYLFDTFYYAPTQSVRTTLNLLFKEEILNHAFLTEKENTARFIQYLGQYVGSLQNEVMKFIVPSDLDFSQRSTSWRYCEYRKSHWIIKTDD